MSSSPTYRSELRMRGTCTDNHRYRKAVISVVYRIKIPYQVSRTLGTGRMTVY